MLGRLCFMPSYPDDPEVILPNGARGRRPRSFRGFIGLGILFLGFLLFHNAVPLYTDWLWFGEVGYRQVFSTTIVAKMTVYFLFALVFLIFFYGNILVARRLAPEKSDRFLMERFGPEWGKRIHKGIGAVALAGSLFLALWAGALAVENWPAWLEFTHWTAFHKLDPVFGNDVGFYVFRVPFLRFLSEFGMGVVILTAIAVVLIHVADQAIESWAGLPNVKPGVRAQLLTLIAFLALLTAFATRLDSYDLLTSDNGKFFGAGYTDLHVRLISQDLEIIFLIVAAVACFAGIALRRRDFRWPIYAAVGWLATVLVGGNVLPGIVQKVYVEPNELSMEQQYISRNIDFTRQGYNLKSVSVDTFPADQSLTPGQLRSNRDTLDNVRLWDYDYLGKVYEQLQTVKTYYKFQKDNADGTRSPNIDIDRYRIGGRLRQVMLAAREMDPGDQPWQNLKLAYTHGYGVVMSPVNRVIGGGPDYFLQGIPLTTSPEAASIAVSQPDIYYGELAHDYVFANTDHQEFDYPSTQGTGGAQDHYVTYTGKGGIRIGDMELAKLAFSLRFGDSNILLARGFKPETRVLFRRDIRDRVRTIAPFLQQDGDPYLVVSPENGRLVWIIDCYTLSDHYPYSRPEQLSVNPVQYITPNYIRNSVKATVDAYDGEVNLYVTDPTDPIAQTYGKIYPGLFKGLAQLPQGLQAHLRYPEDLFRIQRSIYATYHVDDARIFYLKEDAWAIPVEPNGQQTPTANGEDPNIAGSPKQMEPYYVIMRLPNSGGAGAAEKAQGTGGEEFILMSPLSPINRESQNVLGWMCARCDPGHYGELVLYRFPQTVSVEGPSQILQNINTDRVISPQLSLLRQGGSTATFGNMLVIPVEKSLLYIAPMYVEASNPSNKLPQLQKVVVSYGSHVAMENTLDGALADLYSGYTGPATASLTSDAGTGRLSSSGGSMPIQIKTSIDRAAADYATGQERMKAGDWAGYGKAMQDLKQRLDEITNAIGHKSTAPTAPGK